MLISSSYEYVYDVNYFFKVGKLSIWLCDVIISHFDDNKS